MFSFPSSLLLITAKNATLILSIEYISSKQYIENMFFFQPVFTTVFVYSCIKAHSLH